MKAIILAAGYATRLYPLTKDTPKPLLLVAGKAMLAHILEKVHELPEVDKIFVVTNNRFSSHFDRWLSTYPKNAQRTILLNDGTISNDDRLGALGDILFCWECNAFTDDVLIIAGDNLFDFSLRDFIDSYYQKKRPVVALYDLQDAAKVARRFGVAEVDADNRILRFEEKPERPKSTLASTACYVFPQHTLKKIRAYHHTVGKHDNLGDFIAWLAQRETVYGYCFTGRWYDIGSLDQLEEANRVFAVRN